MLYGCQPFKSSLDVGGIGSTDLRIAGGWVKDHNYTFDHKSPACIPQFLNIECFKIFCKICVEKLGKSGRFQGAPSS